MDSVRICATFRSRLSAFRGSIAYFAVFLTCSSLLSQGSAGRILRSITDPTGAVIPGVTVTIRDVDRGTTRTLVTDEAGLYLFRSMPFYNWDLSVTKATKFKERYTAQFRAEFSTCSITRIFPTRSVDRAATTRLRILQQQRVQVSVSAPRHRMLLVRIRCLDPAVTATFSWG